MQTRNAVAPDPSHVDRVIFDPRLVYRHRACARINASGRRVGPPDAYQRESTEAERGKLIRLGPGVSSSAVRFPGASDNPDSKTAGLDLVSHPVTYAGLFASSFVSGVFFRHLFPDEPRHHASTIGFQQGLGVNAREPVEHRSDQAGPAGLVTGSEAGAVVTVEVLVKQDQAALVRIVLEFFRSPVDRSFAVRIAQERAGQATNDLLRHFEERHLLPGTSGHSTLKSSPKKL